MDKPESISKDIYFQVLDCLANWFKDQGAIRRVRYVDGYRINGWYMFIENYGLAMEIRAFVIPSIPIAWFRDNRVRYLQRYFPERKIQRADDWIKRDFIEGFPIREIKLT